MTETPMKRREPTGDERGLMDDLRLTLHKPLYASVSDAPCGGRVAQGGRRSLVQQRPRPVAEVDRL